VILAAGESSRMNAPKALLRLGEESFAQAITRKAQECGINFIYLVAGAQYPKIREELGRSKDFEIIFNPRFPEGQLSSLQEGLRNMPTGSTDVLVWPVDIPLVRQETVQTLIESHISSGNPVTIPVHDGKHGHPVLYNTDAIHTILSLSTDQTAKELQKIYDGRITFVEVDDAAVLLDIDTPEDYRKYVDN
jgi:molybdenum cofactor cytidylyltransferase